MRHEQMGIIRKIIDTAITVGCKRLFFLSALVLIVSFLASSMIPCFLEVQGQVGLRSEPINDEAFDEDDDVHYLDFPSVRESVQFSLLAIPLYHKTPANIFLNETRANIYQIISSNPGMTFGTITRELGLAPGMCQYHVRVLEREGYIKSRRAGKYTRFYLTGEKASEITMIQERIVETVSETQGLYQSQIASDLGVSRQVVNYNIKPLVENGLVKEVRKDNKCFYHIE